MNPAPTTLQAFLLTSQPLFIEAIAPVVSEHSGLELTGVNALFGTADVEGMHIELHTRVERVDNPSWPLQAQLNGVQEPAAPAIAEQQGAIEVVVSRVSDPWAGQQLFASIVELLCRFDAVTLVTIPSQELVTTPELYRHAAESGAPAWFATWAMWIEQGQNSFAVTRGLHQFGFPEIQLAGAPWEPAQTRGLVRNIVASMLEQRVPIQPGIEFDLGDLPVALAPDTDVITGNEVLSISPKQAG